MKKVVTRLGQVTAVAAWLSMAHFNFQFTSLGNRLELGLNRSLGGEGMLIFLALHFAFCILVSIGALIFGVFHFRSVSSKRSKAWALALYFSPLVLFVMSLIIWFHGGYGGPPK